MKIDLAASTHVSNRARAGDERATARLGPAGSRQGGMAVIVMLVLLSIMLGYIAANVYSLRHLQQELKLTEQRQIRRLNPVTATNAVAGSARVAVPIPPNRIGQSNSPSVHP